MARAVVVLVLVLVAACAPVVRGLGPEAVADGGGAALGDTHFTAIDGTDLPLRQWPSAGPPRAILVALHGFADYGRAFEKPGPYWARQGIWTYAPDQRGFGGTPSRGRWPGSEAMMADLDRLVDLARRRHPGTPVFVLGESMGGAVALAAAARPQGLAADGLVLVAPAVWGWSSMPMAARALLWLTAHAMPWNPLTVPRQLRIQACSDIELLRELSKDPLMLRRPRTDMVYGLADLMQQASDGAAQVRLPTLVLWGGKDQIVPRRPIEAAIDDLDGRAREAFYPDGYHMLLRDLDGEAAWADIAHWIGDPAAPLPSGRGARPRDATAQAADHPPR
ncbi:alpha/beta hydrolase [Zavarzinia sp. CC-PAN008]|uniref:alpha/beta hydrolase n=1 Tax=Zavarzinia sp. CC-PAN008 TaxID=3243332 RepID=UPI003F7480BC